jgi:uroporphyrinogen-III synthase
VELPVLRFEKLPVDPGVIEKLVKKPVDWILFTSTRSVRFWAETLMEKGVDFPAETQVACIGEHTAQIADQDGFTADFYPSEPGSEKFLEEFESRLENGSEKPSVFIPMAEGGRTTIRDRLRALGCEVNTLPIYRTLAREDASKQMTQEEISRAALVLFTSPSSVDAFMKNFALPPAEKIASLGNFTAEHLKTCGIANPKVLPEGDFQRIEEVIQW